MGEMIEAKQQESQDLPKMVGNVDLCACAVLAALPIALCWVLAEKRFASANLLFYLRDHRSRPVSDFWVLALSCGIIHSADTIKGHDPTTVSSLFCDAPINAPASLGAAFH